MADAPSVLVRPITAADLSSETRLMRGGIASSAIL